MTSISIVLCTYNGARFLDAQLRSLRAQEGVAEILAQDDRSTDATMAILAEHARQDGRIRFAQNIQRVGVTENFQRAILQARSPWVALSDQDDIWQPWKLARLRSAWDGRSCLLHHASHKFRQEAPDLLPVLAGKIRKFSGEDLRRLLYRNTIVGHTILMRTEVARRLMPFPRSLLHDWWLGVGATAFGPVQYVDEYLVHYRIHETNAYCARGSRARRRREAQELRLRMLQALMERRHLSPEQAAFVREYQAVLRQAQWQVFSLALGWFYWRHAATLFGEACAGASWSTRLRKSLAEAFNPSVCGSRRAGAVAAPWAA